MIKNQNKLKEKLIGKLLGLTYRLDNSGGNSFDKNGEENFINSFVNVTENSNPIIFDIGANIGEYTQILTEKLKDKKYSIHVFEPQKKCFSDLENKFSDNKMVFLNGFGLSNKSEFLTMFKNTEKSPLASLYKRNLDFYNFKMNVEEKIEVKRTDDYIESHNIRHINLVKIDVEGHELVTLEGFGKYLNSDFIDFIQFEYGGTNLDSHTNLLDYYNLLEAKGFKICKIMKGNLEYRTYNPRFDNFVYQNYVAVSKSLFDSLLA